MKTSKQIFEHLTKREDNLFKTLMKFTDSFGEKDLVTKNIRIEWFTTFLLLEWVKEDE